MSVSVPVLTYVDVSGRAQLVALLRNNGPDDIFSVFFLLLSASCNFVSSTPQGKLEISFCCNCFESDLCYELF